MATVDQTRTIKRGDDMGSPHGTDEHHSGWEVEYMCGGDPVRESHPTVRGYEVSVGPGSHESAPTLILTDENEEAVAIYNPAAWIACRRITPLNTLQT